MPQDMFSMVGLGLGWKANLGLLSQRNGQANEALNLRLQCPDHIPIFLEIIGFPSPQTNGYVRKSHKRCVSFSTSALLVRTGQAVLFVACDGTMDIIFSKIWLWLASRDEITVIMYGSCALKCMMVSFFFFFFTVFWFAHCSVYIQSRPAGAVFHHT